MSRRSSSNVVEEKSIPEDKKDLRNEISEIGYFTLFFSDPLMEERWNRAHLKRHISITTRFLFIAAVFQGLFLWSDVIEKQDHLFHLAIIRLMIGGFTLLGSFLVATGLLIPSQSAVLLINLCYGLPSMSLFYLTRRSFSHWQSLYLVYGMCFFILPKISPLSFIYAFLGSSLFTLSFILISAFRLSLQQWLLSNSLLLIVILLFFYDSYSSERITRERWLLRDRLQREHINLKIVASSLEDDFTKSSRHRHPLSLVPSNITNSSLYSARRSVSDSPSVSDGAHVSASPEKEQNAQFKRFVLFFKGLIAWALCYAFGYSFDFISLPIAPASSSSEAHSSAAFALLMHSMGFSIFLLYFTGQIRWLALNGVVSLIIMFIFNHTGMSQKWVIFSTHSLGYVLLAGVIVIMVLVFGGVVLVWTHLVNFIKDVLNRYPQVKDDLGRNQLLESVLIQYIADMPMTGLFSKDENTKHELIIEYGTDNESSRQLRSAPTQTVSDRKKREEATESISRGDTRMVLSSRRPNTCFFCSKPSPTLLVPACQGWQQCIDGEKGSGSGISMCTPYTDMVCSRENMEGKLLEALKQTEFYRAQHEKMEITLKEAEDTANQLRRHVEGSVHELRKRYIEIEGIVQRLVKTCNDRVAAEKFNCENMLQSIISQHNAQLADIKKAHKQALMKFNAGVSPPVVPPPLPLPEQKPVAATNLTFGEKRSRGSASEASVPQVPFKKSSDDGNLTKKKSGSHSISVIAPKRSAVIEAKDSTRIVPPDQASFIVSASSSVDSLSLFEPTAASALESFLSNEHEEDEFDRIWKASLSEIEELFYSTRQRLVGEHSFCSAPLIGVNSFHYTDELSNPVDTPPYWSPLNSTAPNRMKYALAFTEEV